MIVLTASAPFKTDELAVIIKIGSVTRTKIAIEIYALQARQAACEENSPTAYHRGLHNFHFTRESNKLERPGKPTERWKSCDFWSSPTKVIVQFHGSLSSNAINFIQQTNTKPSERPTRLKLFTLLKLHYRTLIDKLKKRKTKSSKITCYFHFQTDRDRSIPIGISANIPSTGDVKVTNSKNKKKLLIENWKNQKSPFSKISCNFRWQKDCDRSI